MRTIFFEITNGFFRWIDAVAELVVKLLERCTVRRVLKLTEKQAGEFEIQIEPRLDTGSVTAQCIQIIEGKIHQSISADLTVKIAGSRVELVLQSGRFLFQPLELPSRAADFLQGIVRTQIDRLTPWNVGEVAFGWTKPNPAEHDRIVITVAATALAAVQPYVQMMVGWGARSVAIFACSPQDITGSFPIKIWEENARDETALGRVRYALCVALAITGIMAGVAIAASAIIGANLDAQQDKLQIQTASLRARMVALRPAASDAKMSARAALERRKQEAPSIVIILDSLSRILPDNTYVTELRVEGNKLRLLGNTSDAPSLIGVIEQSGRFANATFFAPTTRLTAEAGERFHIEATILPVGAPHHHDEPQDRPLSGAAPKLSWVVVWGADYHSQSHRLDWTARPWGTVSRSQCVCGVARSVGETCRNFAPRTWKRQVEVACSCVSGGPNDNSRQCSPFCSGSPAP